MLYIRNEMPYNRNYRRNYNNKSTYRRRPRRIAPVKRLVTGQTQPTMLEKIASYAGPVAQVAKAVLPMIAAINTEEKFSDYSSTSLAPAFTTPPLVQLSLIATGTTESSRIGNSILARDINIRWSLLPNYTNSQTQLFRFIFFVDKQSSGVVPTIAQLLQQPTNIASSFNKNYSDRFAILKDKRFLLTQNGPEMNAVGKMYKKLQFHIRYIGTGSTVADMGNNQIMAFFISNQNTNLSALTLYTRLNFTDN